MIMNNATKIAFRLLDGTMLDLADLPLISRGKVRDIYDAGSDRLLIHTTGRQSAHNRSLAQEVPHKGAVLNQVSKFWFENTRDIVANHMIECPRPDMMLVRRCKALPIEMIVRGYLAKSSSKTSLSGLYAAGQRDFGDFQLPDGLKANQRLSPSVLTPTTKDIDDENVNHKQIVERGLVPEDLLLEIEKISLKLFERGQNISASKGLILVDTKYEFGLDVEGRLTLIDEIHTPDSSRFWEAASYQSRFEAGEAPQAFDKEGLRDWLSANCSIEDLNDINFKPLIPDSVMQTHASKYTDLLKRLTGQTL